MFRRVTVTGRTHLAVEVHKGSLLDRALRGPTLATTTDRGRAERSRLTWGADQPDGPYRLRPLGVLNGLLGLVVWVEDACPRRQCRGRARHSWVLHAFGWALR